MGWEIASKSGHEMVVGRYNTDYTPNSTGGWDTADRLFVVANGTSGAALSNALTIYKDGKMNINDAYDMPTIGGTSGQVLTTNGSVASWQAVPGDNLGDHTATENLQLNDNWLSNDGGNEGLRIDDDGKVGIGQGTGTLGAALHIEANSTTGQFIVEPLAANAQDGIVVIRGARDNIAPSAPTRLRFENYDNNGAPATTHVFGSVNGVIDRCYQ